jgi:hypothetical protein
MERGISYKQSSHRLGIFPKAFEQENHEVVWKNLEEKFFCTSAESRAKPMH